MVGARQAAEEVLSEPLEVLAAEIAENLHTVEPFFPGIDNVVSRRSYERKLWKTLEQGNPNRSR